MTVLALILAAGLITYLTRLSGFLVGSRAIPRWLDRFLLYVPVAAFASLVTPALHVLGGELAARIAGLVAASLVVLRIHHLWAGLVTGMAVYWLVRAVLG